MNKWGLIVINAGNAFGTVRKLRSYTLENILLFQYSKERPFELNDKLSKKPLSDTAKEELDL